MKILSWTYLNMYLINAFFYLAFTVMSPILESESETSSFISKALPSTFPLRFDYLAVEK